MKAVSKFSVRWQVRSSEVNDALSESPQLVNDDCYGEGWFIKLKIADAADLKDLLNREEYAEFVAEEWAEVDAIHPKLRRRPTGDAARNRREVS